LECESTFVPEIHVPKSARLLLAIAALLLSTSPLLPIWRISLIAPQYPEGMGMLIRLNTIQGAKENDLENINHLNHYIGMRMIEPENIPELQHLRSVVLVIAALGLGAAAFGRRAGLYTWAGVFAASGIAGMVDFWWRTYTFGHTLDFAHAAIQIPGLAYQPPLIGVKQIANFTASAWPASGGILIGIAVLLTGAAVWSTLRQPATARHASGSIADALARPHAA
jgi:copper chaperone NosL